MAVGNNDPIYAEQALQDLKDLQIVDKINTIQIVISKRDIKEHVRTTIGERWASFDQMRMIKMKVLDSDANCKVVNINKNSDIWNNDKASKKFNNSGYKTIKINMGGKTQTLYKDGDSPSKSPTGKSAQSSNPSDVPEVKKWYNIVKLNMGDKTSVIRDDSK